MEVKEEIQWNTLNNSANVEFKNKIREELGMMFSADADKFLRTEVENNLVEKSNSFDLKLQKRTMKA